MKKYRPTCCYLLLFAATLLSACNNGQGQRGASNRNHGPGVGPKYGTKFLIAWVTIDSPKNEYWKAYDEGLKTAIAEAGGEMLYLSAQGDPTKQHDCVSQAIAQDIDMLLVYPIDTNAIGAAIQEANAANIPVGVLWNPVPAVSGAKVDLTVSIDDEEAARRSAQVIVDKLVEKYGEPRGDILEVQGRMVTAGGKRRGAGFHDVIDKFPNIKVASKPGDWDTGKGTTIIQDWFSAYPATDAIFFHSDGAYTPAAVAALSPLGRWRPEPDPGHVICTGVDGSNIAVHAIKYGYMEHTSGSEHADAGGLLGWLAMELLKSGTQPKPGEQVHCPDKSWKAADVVEDPAYSGPLVYIPIASISADNAVDPNLFANKHQGPPNGLTEECVWEQ